MAGEIGQRRLSPRRGSGPVVVAADPVCRARLDAPKVLFRAVYRGQAYYFCSGECKDRFDRNPERYVEEIDRPAGGAADAKEPR